MIQKFILVVMLFLSFLSMPYLVLAQDVDEEQPEQKQTTSSDLEVDGFNIIPELDEKEITTVNDAITDIWTGGWQVWNKYNQYASEMTTSQQLASWIMNRDTIMDYLVFVVQFISQLWLTVGVIFIMYAWYEYMLSVFKGWKAPSDMVKNAIIGVIIVIFSYAILRILTAAIWIN